MAVEIPDKLYFRIGEVCAIVGVEAHVLRSWEKEFPKVRPRKSRGGQRLYRRKDVEALLAIRELIQDEGFTLPGAKRQLSQASSAPPETLLALRKELMALLSDIRGEEESLSRQLSLKVDLGEERPAEGRGISSSAAHGERPQEDSAESLPPRRASS